MSTALSRKSAKPAANTFSGHIKELRTRLFLVAGVFFVLSLVAYSVRDVLIDIVLTPIGHQKLVYLTPAGGFNFIFSITMYAAAIVTIPFLLYQVYQFVKPTLPEKARRYSLAVFLVAIILMVSGVLFGYYVAVPSALQFLTTFAGDFIEANLTAESYLNFFIAYVVGLGLLFQLPLLLLFWNWIAPIKKGGLLNSQRYVIAGSFIVAAMITPTPDAMNQALVAGPIIGIYQLGVIAVATMNSRARRTAAKQAKKAKLARPKVVSFDAEVEPTGKPQPRPSVAVAPVKKPTPQPAAAKATPVRRHVKSMDMVGPIAHAVRTQRSAVAVPASRAVASSRRSLDGISTSRSQGPTYHRKSLT